MDRNGAKASPFTQGRDDGLGAVGTRAKNKIQLGDLSFDWQGPAPILPEKEEEDVGPIDLDAGPGGMGSYFGDTPWFPTGHAPPSVFSEANGSAPEPASAFEGARGGSRHDRAADRTHANQGRRDRDRPDR